MPIAGLKENSKALPEESMIERWREPPLAFPCPLERGCGLMSKNSAASTKTEPMMASKRVRQKLVPSQQMLKTLRLKRSTFRLKKKFELGVGGLLPSISVSRFDR